MYCMFMRVDVFITSITIISTALLSLLSFSVDETKCDFGSKEETLGPTCFNIFRIFRSLRKVLGLISLFFVCYIPIIPSDIKKSSACEKSFLK